MKPLKIIYNIFVTCLVAMALLLAISVLPITGNFKILTVLSGSMEPALHIGSVVAIKPAKEYQVGDIITFNQNSKTKIPTTHRIFDIKIQEGKPVYITKGDNNSVPDRTEILKNEIVGKALFSVPYLGYAIDFVKKPLGFMLIIIIPVVIIIYDEVNKIIAEVKKMREKKKFEIEKQEKQEE
jgi:signal peptidase I